MRMSADFDGIQIGTGQLFADDFLVVVFFLSAE